MSGIALFDAKNRLSELIHRVEAGEQITITRRGKAVARLVPASSPKADKKARDAIEELRAARESVSLGTLRSRELIRAGRR